jgi:hypothetical protein
LGGGVDERRSGSRVALGNTAARGAEGEEVGGGSMLEEAGFAASSPLSDGLDEGAPAVG